jgi:corrinoid protein of di/trimethylamine methyltransferase
MNELLEKIRGAIIHQDIQAAPTLTDEAIAAGIPPDILINDGLIAAMDVVGAQFGNQEIFVPEMLVSAKLMSDALAKVKPLLVGDAVSSRGTVIMCTVKGDLHDIGKNLVTMMLEGAGFTVHDLGVNITSSQVVEKVRTIKPDILGLSALLTTTMPEMGKVVRLLTDAGIRENVKVMVGGAPVNSNFADEVDADGYAEDAAQAVVLARNLIG